MREHEVPTHVQAEDRVLLWFTFPKVVVVVPEQNVDYRRVSDGLKTTSPPLTDRFPDLETVESTMRAVLKNPDAHFHMVAPHTLVDAVCRERPVEAALWAEYWRERYGV